tara:strand:- start:582 stop:2615 length:2034 start_codon:yes stop_codon:yes gene_type:complete
MALNSATFKSNKGRDIKYLNKDFAQFRQNLIEYAKTYFPKTYSDFNESSPGMMFIEMASYVGDILSYYTDDSLKESLMLYAEDKANVIALAKYLGYQPKVTSPAVAEISVYQLVPSIYNSNSKSGTNYEPDSRFYLRVKEGMIIQSSKSNTRFRTSELLDFNDENDREISVWAYDPNDNTKPLQYLVKKKIKAISAELKEFSETFNGNTSFSKINIGDTNVVDIVDVRDSNGNKWYGVPYLAQELVYIDYPTTEQYDKDLSQFGDTVPRILKTLKTSRRFTTQVNDDNTTSLVFGGGTASDDETLIPNFKNVGLGLNNSIDKLGASFDPSNFLKTKSYGQAPSGTFTIQYLVGGGVESNVAKGELTSIQRIEYDEDTTIFTPSELRLYNQGKASIACDNESPATGGRGEETIDEIRENALANFGSQNRAVTRKDYQVRALSLPAKFGGVAKAFCAPDGELDNNSPSSILNNPNSLEEFAGLVQTLGEKKLTEQQIKDELRNFLASKKSNQNEKNNPFAINLYLLGYDTNRKLQTLNRAVKENLKTYLGEYRMLTDGVNFIDGYIINIGLDFEIRVYGGYTKREVLTKCINELKEYFDISNWTFNMPINISEIELLIAGVEGVQSVPKCEIINKCLGNYSEHSYNILDATKGKMVYPSLDPSIFEVKFPNKDIRGRVV